jgi:Fic family protein
MQKSDLTMRSAGYTYLMDQLGFTGIPNWHQSYISATSIQHLKQHGNIIEELYRSSHWPGDKLVDHLEFALKYDGVNLALLSRIFEYLSEKELAEYIQSKPTSKYARRIWFFYEFLTGRKLPIDDLLYGNYVDALDQDKYYTLNKGEKSSRQRINNNLLGPTSFCPIIRKTQMLSLMEKDDLRQRCETMLANYSPELLRRATNYLYSKETKSSFEIEHIAHDASRVEKFITILKLAELEDYVDKDRLIEIQHSIVDPRFKDIDYRSSQNYIGQTLAFYKEVIHYICPKPLDLPALMSGLMESHQKMKKSQISAIIHATVISYGFVYLHPFEDGNGRIHRFLIHNILAQKGILPTGIMFPVSAVMLKHSADYDASLEAFSQPLLQLIEYSLDDIGQMTVANDTACWYRFIDLTLQAEALYAFVIKTIDDEMDLELKFLASYDQAKKRIQGIVDVPDRLIDLFIHLLTQNNGKLSTGKKSTHFNMLTDNEIEAMEGAVKDSFG